MSTVAQRYAQAALEVAQVHGEGGQAGQDKLVQDLKTFARAIIDVPDLKQVLSHPALVTERSQVVPKICEALALGEVSKRLVDLLLKTHRFGIFLDVVSAAENMADAKAKRLRAQVTFATPPTAVQLEKLMQVLGKKTGHLVHIHVQVDASLMAGMVIKMAGLTIDSSTRNQFDTLRANLTQANVATL